MKHFLFLIIILGDKAGATMFTLYILSSIVISLTQPAIALNFPTKLAGKSLTSFNVFLFCINFVYLQLRAHLQPKRVFYL